MLSSIDTSARLAASGSRRGSPGLAPERALDDALVALERRPIGDGVFARQRAAAAHVLVVLELNLPALDAHDPGPQHRQQARRRRTRLLAEPRSPPARRPPDPTGCRAGTCRARRAPDPPRTRAHQVLLQRTHAEDEEAAQAHGQQDDAHLDPGRLSCSTAWRSANHRALASGRISRISSEPARCSTSVVAARPTVDDQPDAPRSRPATP